MTHERAEEYRRQAQESLTLARAVSTEEARIALIEMAQTWLRRAEEQEHESANIDSPPPSPVEDRPAVQQQQQVQPKDDKE